MNGGERVAAVLAAQGVPFLFTLCGGHISPILVGCKRRGIRVIDVRHEATAVFAADAVARLTGIPGVAAVTAGPGATNTITALKNAQLAQSPVILLGGAAATVLRGRGSLQDIDQVALMRPHCKRIFAVRRLRDLGPALEEAFAVAQQGIPGPVFVECPIDLLYDEALVRSWYGASSSSSTKTSRRRGLGANVERLYLDWHVRRMFADAAAFTPGLLRAPLVPEAMVPSVSAAAERLARAERPVVLVGSQALLDAPRAGEVAAALRRLGVPVYLSGMARGLLGARDTLQLRHKRREALGEADLVLLAGVPCDFRLDYGRHIRRSSYLVSVNRSRAELRRNRRPDLGVEADPGRFLSQLAERFDAASAGRWHAWRERLAGRDAARERQIDEMATAPAGGMLNPLEVCRAMESALDARSVIVADGGDFVATASYTVRARGPLSWLDPGAFGTLGVGAGFALGAKLCAPDAEVWIVYGDGSVGYSLMEIDTFVRHQLPVIAVVGNDAAWMQIARDQVDFLGDDVGTVLRRTDYHLAAQGLGGRGLLLDDSTRVAEVLAEAKEIARGGTPVLVNAQIGRTDFRKGSLSM